MKTKNTKEFETDITLHLIRIGSDVEHIKDNIDSINKHLQLINGRVRENEKDITKLKTVGITLFTLLGIAISVVGLVQ